MIKQDRKQFYYKPDNGNGRNKHIRAWELLCQLAIEKKYKTHLNDRTIDGFCHCVSAWFVMHDVERVQDGNVFIVDSRFAVEVIGTHREPGQAPSYRGDFIHVPVGCLWDFLTWFDKVFGIDF